MLAFPPAMAQDGEDRTPAGAELTWHVASVVNPVPTPETTVPIGPDIGVNVIVPAGPRVTAKLAVAESAAPAFVTTVTVYDVPVVALDATLKPPVSEPATMLHDWEVKRPLGTEVSKHVAP
jgi:hypothetical protein